MGAKTLGTTPQRSRQMALVRGKGNRSTEERLTRILRAEGITGWRRHVAIAGVKGRPDFVFRSQRVAIFVDGCFWHGCPVCQRRAPVNNREFWAEKIAGNVRRDRRDTRELRSLRWAVLRIWEHCLSTEVRVLRRVDAALSRAAGRGTSLRSVHPTQSF